MSFNSLSQYSFNHTLLAQLQLATEDRFDLAEELGSCLLHLFKQIPPLDRRAAVQSLALELIQFKSLDNLDALKKKLLPSSQPHWKAALLNVNLTTTLNLHEVNIEYSNRMNLPLGLERVKVIRDQELSTVFASTFATNQEHRINDEGNTLLDAVFAASCVNAQGSFSGFALALSDGAGGHFGDHQQDKRISKAAHIATKLAVQLMSAYHQPEMLIADFPALIWQVSQAIQDKAQGEGATLVACRVFPTSRGFRVIGINIGDNMLVSWDPTTQLFSQLFASHATEVGTAFLPNVYRPFEVQKIDQTLPNKSLLFLMSDGVHDTLPFEEREGVYPNGLKYSIRSLTGMETLFKSVDPTTSTMTYLDALTGKSLQGAERLRQERLNQVNSCIGDDFSLLECRLVNPQSNGFFKRLKKWITD
ncbi:MAG: protein phosphatase 2C domain-containing protein [Candidatus Rhabdochlamydia sp.]